MAALAARDVTLDPMITATVMGPKPTPEMLGMVLHMPAGWRTV